MEKYHDYAIGIYIFKEDCKFKPLFLINIYN